MDAAVLVAATAPGVFKCCKNANLSCLPTSWHWFVLLFAGLIPFIWCFAAPTSLRFGFSLGEYRLGERSCHEVARKFCFLSILSEIGNIILGTFILPLQCLLLEHRYGTGDCLCVLSVLRDPFSWTMFMSFMGVSSSLVWWLRCEVPVWIISLSMFAVVLAGDEVESKTLVLRIVIFALHHFLLRAFFIRFAGTFSYVEGVLLAQLFSLVLGVSLLNAVDSCSLSVASWSILHWVSFVGTCLAVVGIGVFSFRHMCPTPRKLTAAITLCLLIILTLPGIQLVWISTTDDPSSVGYPTLSLILPFMTRKRWAIVWMWVTLLLGAVGFLFKVAADVHTRFHVRKAFHLLGVMVFAPVIMIDDLGFLSLAFVTAVFAFVALEMFRSASDDVVSNRLTSWLGRFVDERDRGALITTHLHLLLGLGLPVLIGWGIEELFPNHVNAKPKKFIPWIGVITVGIGDAAAAVFGKRYGRCWFPFSDDKTCEGVAAFIICAIAVVMGLGIRFGEGESFISVDGSILTSIFMTAFYEGWTKDCDNLTVSIFGVVSYLSSLLLYGDD